MGLNHSHTHEITLSNTFKTGIAINIIFIIVEAFFGYFSNSMALVADAGHNLCDAVALVFSWIAVILSQRKPTLKFTYGFRRSTILIALFNTIFLLAAVVFIVWETIARIGNPIEINSTSVISVASIGIGVNGFTAWLFLKENKHDLNIRSTFVHFFADALVSIGVVVAGIVMALTGIVWVDTLVSFIIVAVILYSLYHLLIDSVNLALDAVPENINMEAIGEFLKTLPEVEAIHDLHIWALSTTNTALTVHLATNTQTDVAFVTNIQHRLRKQFGIEHATIQVEYGVGIDNCETNCNEY
jgi:cobalt-zinc-cadmium efflux system protein